MKKLWLRVCSMLLAICITANLLPLTAWADQINESDSQLSVTEETEQTSDQASAQAQIIGEVIENRTEFTKEFLLDGGLSLAVVYDSAVHYEKDGQWEEIDNTLKSNLSGTYTNTAGVWDVSFPKQMSANKQISVTKDGYTLSFAMAGELLKQGNLEVMSVEVPSELEAQTVSGRSILTTLSVDPQETVPETTAPAETTPETTEPEETVPETTAPSETIPEESIPEDTVPEETVSEETVPEETVPEETKPEETVPETTVPEETNPTEATLPEITPTEAVVTPAVPTVSVTVNGKVETFAVNSAKTSSGQIQKIDMREALAEEEYKETVLTKPVSQLHYGSVYTNTDIRYDLKGKELKESIILKNYNSSLRGYQFALNTGTLIPVMSDDGSIDICAPDGKTLVMHMPAPYLVDSNDIHCDDIRVSLSGKDGIYTLTYILPQQWLASTERTWPVILDPVIVPDMDTDNIRDRTVVSKGSSAQEWGMLQAGYSTGAGIARFFLKYDDLPTIQASDVIVSAQIKLRRPSDTAESIPIEVHKVNETWKSETITWSKMPACDEDNVVDYAWIKKTAGWYWWDVTDIARDWYSTGVNTGMMFKAPEEIEESTTTHYKQFYSSDYSTNSAPVLFIVFRNNNGLEGYWDYTSSDAGRAGTGYVNQYSGNLIWSFSDMGFGGNRMPVSISHIYNSNDRTVTRFGMGAGWRINYNQRIYQWSKNSLYYVWEDGDGTDHYFLYSKSNTYKDEDGMEMTLTTGGSGTSTYKLKDKNGNISYFDANGRLRKIQNNQKTKSSITITYTTTSSHRIKTITDGAGRKYTFSYTDELLRRISYTGLPAENGETDIELAYTTYSYDTADRPNLTGVTWQDGKSTQYTYVSGTNFLTEAKDIDDYKLRYTYDSTASGKPNRIVKISEFDGSEAGGVLNFTYDYNQTTITDQTDDNDETFNTQILQFNNMGNTLSIQDGEGHAQYAMYAKNNDEDEGKGNQLTASSKLQNTVGNLLPNHSFEFVENNSNLYGWTVSGTATVSTDAYLGGKALSLTSGSAASDEFDVPAGESITFSAYVKTGGSNSYLELKSGSTTLASQRITDATDWTRVEVSYHNTGTGSPNVKAVLRAGSGQTVLMDCAQLESCPTASRYNLVTNGDFSRTTGTPAALTQWTLPEGVAASEIYAVTTASNQAAPQLDSNVLTVPGDPAAEKGISQTLPISGDAGDCFIVSGWAKGDSAAIDDHDSRGRTFAVQMSFHYTEEIPEDEAEEAAKSFDADFNPHSNHWQYSATAAVAKYAYDSVTVRVAYDYNINQAQFDGIQLYKEEFSQSYTYDEDGNLISVVDLQKKKTEYEYDDTTNDLLKVILPDNGGTMEYTYDSYHNVLTATSAEGLKYDFTYDEYGNNTGVSTTVFYNTIQGGTTIGPGTTSSVETLSATAVYSSDGNRLLYTVDAAGNETYYEYDAETNVLDWVKYPEDSDTTKTSYTYDEMYRMSTAAVTTDTGLSLSAAYTYQNDLLTSLETESTIYTFTYGNFALRSSVKIGSRILAEYKYTDQDNYLQELDYGNHDKVQYTYDEQGRVTKQIYYNQATNQNDTVTYRYDNDGALATVTDSATGRTTTYYYDFIDRMMKYVESGDNYSHSVGYDYDDRNNLKQLVESINGTSVTTSYAYDKDNRVTTVAVESSAADTEIQKTYGYDSFGRGVGSETLQDGAMIKKDVYTFTDSKASEGTPDGSLEEIPEGEEGTPLEGETSEGNISLLTGTGTTNQIETHTIKLGSLDPAANANPGWNDTTDGGGASGNDGLIENGDYEEVEGELYKSFTYDYDDNGNILSISDGTHTITYVYDSANQLVRENNQAGGFTHIWAYDNAGNILSRAEYDYTTDEPGTPKDTVSYSYGDNDWGDLLTAYDGNTITYDAIGNPLNDGRRTYTWKHGRQLATLTQSGTTWNFTYNADGLRTKRTNGTKTYNYVYNGDKLSQMTVGSDTLNFAYDASGTPMTVVYGNTIFYYITNIQGDVIAIVDTLGEAVVEYTYDAWGKLLSTTGNMAEILGELNPLRYRSYVYDPEYEFYYLQSRYYNPDVGRFLNADIYASTGQGILGNNMFAYCQNNPIVFIDPDGLCREVGALLTWIDCGDPRCSTSSVNNPSRYYAGYNNPKTDNYLNAVLYYSSLLNTSCRYPVYSYIVDRFSTPEKSQNTLTGIGLVIDGMAAYCGVASIYSALPTFGIGTAAMGSLGIILGALSLPFHAASWIIGRINEE